MAIVDNKTALKNVRQRNYLARDFDSLRTVILEYARQYYPDRIQDFSESSFGGLMLDMASYVGDNMSFYLDHLYNELNGSTAVETSNINQYLKNSGVKITGASPALVYADIFLEVPTVNDGKSSPDTSLLPIVQANTTARADNGTQFTLIEDVSFWDFDKTTNLPMLASSVEQSIGRKSGGTIVTKILKATGLFSSGRETSETFTIGDFIAFRKLTLAQSDVTAIISVVDGLGNEYYQVESLTNDVVYKNTLNTTEKDSIVKDTLKVIPAPYRYVADVALGSRKTTLTFGGGTADSLEDDTIPDPSEFAIPLPYSQTFSRVAINSQSMLQTATLGVASANTSLTVTYRYGGGINHNISANSLRNIETLNITFPENPSAGNQSQIRNSVEITNPKAASGGEDPPTTEQLIAVAPVMKNSQERIVTKEDLLARVYTMPSNFGRVFRAAVSKNPQNPLASQLFIVSRDVNNNLIVSPDVLKDNLKRYLNSYRMVSDSLDVLDAAIINLQLTFQVVIDPSMNKVIILQKIINDLTSQFAITNMHINQPIVISDVISTIFSTKGIISVDSVEFKNLYETVKNITYSPIRFDVKNNTRRQIILPPTGAIFEIKQPEINIIGRALSNV